MGGRGANKQLNSCRPPIIFYRAFWRYLIVCFPPHGGASRRRLTAIENNILSRLSALLDSIFPASRWRLTAVIDFICASSWRHQFSLRLTAIIDFSLPLGKNRFHSTLWQFTPHGDNRFFLCLTARIDFILPDGDSRHTALSIFSSPHGDNRFFLCSKESSSYNPSGHFIRGIFSFLLHPF